MRVALSSHEDIIRRLLAMICGDDVPTDRFEFVVDRIMELINLCR